MLIRLFGIPLQPSLIAAVVGVAASVMLFSLASEQERAFTRQAFALQSETEFADISAELEGLIGKLESLRGFVRNKLVVENCPRISYLDFLFLDKGVRIDRGWITSAWLPRVPVGQIGGFHDAAVRDGWKEDLRFAPPAGEQKETFPAYYIETQSTDVYPIGMNFAANDDFAELFRESRDTGKVRMLARHDREDSSIVGLVWPVYAIGYAPDRPEQRRSELLGFVFGEWDLAAVLGQSLRKFHWDDRLVTLELDDGRHLHRLAAIGSQEPLADLSWEKHLPFAGREFRVNFTATPGFIHSQANAYDWMALFAGLLLTSMLVLYLRTEEVNRRRIQQQVHDRTAEYHETHARLLGVLEHLRGGFAITDDAGLVRLCNRSMPEMLKLPSDQELLGMPQSELVASINKLVAPDCRLDSAYFGNHRTNFQLFDERGEHHFELDFVPITPAIGPSGSIWHLRDITERVQLNRSFEHAQRLESLGLLAGGVAHDFNNILTAILGNLSLLESRLKRGEDVDEFIARIEQAADKAANLCRQMLAYSGKGRMVVQRIDLNAQIKGVTDLMRVSVPRHISLDISLAPQLPDIEGDTSQIQQVILNLVKNAADAIDGKVGAIHIGTRIEQVMPHPMPAFLLSVPATGNYAAISISDTGCGMDELTLSRIFDPFFTTKTDGHGLGMSAVLGIMRSHRGFIEVDSEPGRGTTFRLYFPLSSTSERRESIEETSRNIRLSGRMLLVEDEEQILASTACILRDAGMQVVTARDGLQALELFEPVRFDLVLMDISMPRMSGIECMHRIHAIEPACRVVLTSGFYEQEIRLQQEGGGQVAFVQKPYTSASLLRELAEVMR